MEDMNKTDTSKGLEYELIVGIVREHEEIKRQILELRQSVGDAGADAVRAHKRITTLEQRMDELASVISDMRLDMGSIRVTVTEFGPKQDAFLDKTWGLVTKLLIIVGTTVTILGAIVGAKVSLPFFN